MSIVDPSGKRVGGEYEQQIGWKTLSNPEAPGLVKLQFYLMSEERVILEMVFGPEELKAFVESLQSSSQKYIS